MKVFYIIALLLTGLFSIGCSSNVRLENESTLQAFFELVMINDYASAYNLTSKSYKENISYDDFKNELEGHVKNGVTFTKYEFLTVTRNSKTSRASDIITNQYYYVYWLKHFSNDGKLYKAYYKINYANDSFLIDLISPPVESTESLKYRYGDVNFPLMKGELFTKRVKEKMDKARGSLKQ